MNRATIGWIIIGLMMPSVIWAFWYLAHGAKLVHDDINNFKHRAFNAESFEELENIEVSLRIYAVKNCWHRHLTSHANDVLNYIHGRMRSYN
jgi:hypothetical protein